LAVDGAYLATPVKRDTTWEDQLSEDSIQGWLVQSPWGVVSGPFRTNEEAHAQRAISAAGSAEADLWTILPEQFEDEPVWAQVTS
jgi:hypothetical protein